MYLLTNIQIKPNKMESNINKFKNQIKTDSETSGWDAILNPFVDSKSFEDVFSFLESAVNNGLRFTPPFKDVFNAFKECSYNDLKVVIVGQDPYPHFGVADGLAFSCSNTGKPQPSLKNIFDAINHTVHDDWPIEQDADLTRWANQGVLLLNSALTCQIDKVGSHYAIWKDFIAYLLDVLNHSDSPLIFVLMGKQAQELESIIDDKHHIIKISKKN
jgi:uracil-DNA glycosylase